MIKETWNEIVQNQDVRQNLSKLRQEMKEGRGREAACSCISGEEEKLILLLESEDAKIRKNAALLMGDLGNQEYLEPVLKAYRSEEQLFVKSSYLNAVKKFDYGEHLAFFKKRLDELAKIKLTPETEKHITEEIRELSSMIISREGVLLHPFCGWEETFDIVLLTNRNFQEITREELRKLEPHAKTKVFGAGVMARVENLNWLEEIRTYQELLFAVKGLPSCPMDAEKAAEMIVKSDLFKFLARSHEGNPPYYFRVELKCKMDHSKKSAFTRRLSSKIEKLSGRKLINTTSNYEFEIRLIENKEGSCNVLIKLFTLKDERFSYRKEVIPTSIKAVNAALTVKLAQPYMKEGAQVLDPFCGVGTMLIERHKAVKAGTMYGLDILEEAIEKARENTAAAGQIIHYINRDFFDFKHEYLFDEIITNMPFKIGRKTEEEIENLYEAFFSSAKKVLKDDGIMILYSHNAGHVKKMAPANGFTVSETFEISLKEGTYVFVLNWRQ
ncbi:MULTISPECIES: methyltransferase domain-containing protein [Hungatella]|uniref:TRM11 family SAM-dependent methyltransferase n=1 Tax=Hungatella TaxID=1649459 RepID=UPI00210CF688|nr:methyltransferase domain-containing protein [Hungatella sp. SL.1.14]MCQ4829501.1 methyltransferase [Hungatella sp. SL.1.14]